MSEIPGLQITSGLSSTNSWLMSYDALRQGLFVASGSTVKIYRLDFSTCFGR